MGIIYLLLIYLGFGLVLYLLQKSFIYFPVKGPGNLGLQEEFFSSGSETIQVLVINPDQQDALIYFGGNAEAVAHNRYDFGNIFKNISVYLVNYRGYGESTGRPSEQALYQDAELVYDKLKERHRHLSIMGRSLGSGIATYLAANRATHKLILVTPFDSIEKIAQRRFPIYPISLLLREKYQSDRRVKNITAPTLVIMAEHDQIVPRKNSERLLEQFKPHQVRVQIISGADHNSISSFPEYLQGIQQFLFGMPK